MKPTLPTLNIDLGLATTSSPVNSTTSTETDIASCPFHILSLGTAAQTKEELSRNPSEIHSNNLGFFVVILERMETEAQLMELVYSGVMLKVVNLVLIMRTGEKGTYAQA